MAEARRAKATQAAKVAAEAEAADKEKELDPPASSSGHTPTIVGACPDAGSSSSSVAGSSWYHPHQCKYWPELQRELNDRFVAMTAHARKLHGADGGGGDAGGGDGGGGDGGGGDGGGNGGGGDGGGGDGGGSDGGGDDGGTSDTSSSDVDGGFPPEHAPAGLAGDDGGGSSSDETSSETSVIGRY